MKWRVSGEVTPPGDKSISHRALIISALSTGRSRIRGILDSADTRSTAEVLRKLGYHIPAFADEMVVTGVGRADRRGLGGTARPAEDLDCGNSGTTARLVAGLVAGSGKSARFTGDASLSRRPMRRVAEPLRAMGARVELENDDGLPMRVSGGQLHAISWRSTQASAQVKGAILLAAMASGVEVEIEEPVATRDHTERMLASAGALISAGGGRVALGTGGNLRATDWVVPGDPSSAAYLIAAALIADDGALRVRGVSVNPTRTACLDVLLRMGATLEVVPNSSDDAEPGGDVTARSSTLRAVDIGAEEIPGLIDEIPLIACVAARSAGTARITGASELRVKESDRIRAVVDNLRILGADAEELHDGMVINGTDRPLAGSVSTRGDHRIAMAFGVLAADPRNDIRIDDPGCVGISYPSFWTDLSRISSAQ
jgi:3-phosphoshikimate 1-carboxyvinyltransferase